MVDLNDDGLNGVHDDDGDSIVHLMVYLMVVLMVDLMVHLMMDLMVYMMMSLMVDSIVY